MLVDAKKAREILGVSQSTLSRMRKRGDIEAFIDGRYYVYNVSAYVEAESPYQEALEKDPPMANDADPAYFYNEATERYVFNLRCLGGEAFSASKQQVEEAVAAYTKAGQNATAAEVARAHGWTEATTREIFKLLGKYKASLPFTDEHIAETSEEDLVQSLIRQKEQSVHVKSERAIWKKTVKDAENWQRLDHQIVRPLMSLIPKSFPLTPIVVKKGKSKSDPFDAFIMPSDLHVGKDGWALECGSDYGIDITRARLISATEDLAEKIARHGTPRRIITGVGSDFFHVDNYHGQTTRGTPQDTDGSVAKIMYEGFNLWREFIEMLRQIAPVEMFAMAGNHDMILSFALIMMCESHWRNCSDVAVNVSPCARSYTMAGNTCVGISHSEDTKHSDLASLMSVEAREMWGKAKNQVWFTGHWHADMTSESRGTKVHVVPSLSGTDRWHKRKGYVGNQRILPAYILDHKHGEVAQLNGIPSV